MGFAPESPGGFIGWVMEYGQILLFVAQLVYWLGILVLLGYAVAQFKRWVNYQLGTGRSGALRDGRPVAPETGSKRDSEKTVTVEEFVD